jgi:hypothetical protein
MPELREDNVPIGNLLLDPNNYRYQDIPGFVYADDSRLHEDSVQATAYKRLRSDEGLAQLKNSFRTNGFIPVERLVVRPYSTVPGKYLVLEGNRRTAALKWLLEDHAAGVTVQAPILESLQKVPVVIADNPNDAAFYESLMGVRHVSGIREWGAYQRAKLVVALKDKHGLSSAEVADRLGMTAHEVNRRFRAYKALEQMQNDDSYSQYAKPELYLIFHEAVSLTSVKEWLGWQSDKDEFTNQTTLEQFYELISPREDDSGRIKEPKIASYAQVRELRHVLAHPEAKRILQDPEKSFIEAVALAKREDLSRAWVTAVVEAIAALQTVGVLDIQKLSAEDLAQLESLINTGKSVLEAYNKLKA